MSTSGEHKHKSCQTCGQSHRNRRDNFCNDCRKLKVSEDRIEKINIEQIKSLTTIENDERTQLDSVGAIGLGHIYLDFIRILDVISTSLSEERERDQTHREEEETWDKLVIEESKLRFSIRVMDVLRRGPRKVIRRRKVSLGRWIWLASRIKISQVWNRFVVSSIWSFSFGSIFSMRNKYLG